MSTWACTMMRNEADVAAEVLRHVASEGVEGIIVADNGSTDGTREILDALVLACELEVLDDPEVAYYQAEKMTRLARRAHHTHGATWVVPFDADEVWYSTTEPLAATLARCDADYATAQLWNHFATSIDPEGEHPFRALGWRQRVPGALPKVAVRWRDDAHLTQGNHAVAFARPAVEARHALHVRHFPYRSFEQFRSKAIQGAAAYAAATDLPAEMGAHWRQYGAIHDRRGDAGLREVYDRWFHFVAPIEGGLMFDPAPLRRW